VTVNVSWWFSTTVGVNGTMTKWRKVLGVTINEVCHLQNNWSLYICIQRHALMENTHSLQSFGRISFRWANSYCVQIFNLFCWENWE